MSQSKNKLKTKQRTKLSKKPKEEQTKKKWLQFPLFRANQQLLEGKLSNKIKRQA